MLTPDTLRPRLLEDPAEAPITFNVAAALLGITRSALLECVRRGEFTPIKLKLEDTVYRHIRAGELIAKLQGVDPTAIPDNETCARIVREKLEEMATKPDLPMTLTYQPVMEWVGMNHRLSNHRRRIGIILGMISEVTHEESKDGIMLSAMVIRKDTGRPSDSFFGLAMRLRAWPQGMSKDECWKLHLQLIGKHFGRPKRKNKR